MKMRRKFNLFEKFNEENRNKGIAFKMYKNDFSDRKQSHSKTNIRNIDTSDKLFSYTLPGSTFNVSNRMESALSLSARNKDNAYEYKDSSSNLNNHQLNRVSHPK